MKTLTMKPLIPKTWYLIPSLLLALLVLGVPAHGAGIGIPPRLDKGSNVVVTTNGPAWWTISATASAGGGTVVTGAYNFLATAPATVSVVGTNVTTGVDTNTLATRDWVSVNGGSSLLIGGTLFVATNGNNSTAQRTNWHRPFATLQAAINAASTGDTIIVGPGTFAGATVSSQRDISIVGVSPNQTHIASSGITFGTNTSVANLSLYQATWNAAVNPKLLNCIVTGSLSDGVLVSSAATTVSTGEVRNCYISSEWDGIANQKAGWLIQAFNTHVEITSNGSGTGTSVGLLAESGGKIEFYNGRIRVRSGTGTEIGAYADGGTNIVVNSSVDAVSAFTQTGGGVIEVAHTDYDTNTVSGTIILRDRDELMASLTRATFVSPTFTGTITNAPGTRIIGTGSNSVESITTISGTNLNLSGTASVNALTVTNGGTLSGVFSGAGLSTITNMTAGSFSNGVTVGGTAGLYSGTSFRYFLFSSVGSSISSGSGGTYINVNQPANGGIEINGQSAVTRMTGGGGVNIVGNLTNSGTVTATNGVYYPSNSVAAATVVTDLPEGGYWLGTMSNRLQSAYKTNGTVTWKILMP